MLGQTEIAWLSGFLDADGMIRLRKGQKNPTGPKSLVPLVTYTNTCALTGRRLAELIGKSFTDFTATVSKDGSRNPWCPKITIEIGAIKRVMPFLQMVRPFLVTKAGEADLVLEFCRLRKIKYRAPYSDREYQIFEALKYLKQTRHLRDYTPNIEEVLGEDIVRTNAKALEVAEMSTRQPVEVGKEWAKNLVSRYRWNKAESNS
ncbi:MAG: hypothetical protein KGL39_60560 [Patescibacteria group bacterium]|nr:hypothetical protein [Patescibacteria group bacterium]